MEIVTDEACLVYKLPGHPERPERVARTLDLLRRQGSLKASWNKPVAVPDSAILRANSLPQERPPVSERATPAGVTQRGARVDRRRPVPGTRQKH